MVHLQCQFEHDPRACFDQRDLSRRDGLFFKQPIHHQAAAGEAGSTGPERPTSKQVSLEQSGGRATRRIGPLHRDLDRFSYRAQSNL